MTAPVDRHSTVTDGDWFIVAVDFAIGAVYDEGRSASSTATTAGLSATRGVDRVMVTRFLGGAGAISGTEAEAGVISSVAANSSVSTTTLMGVLRRVFVARAMVGLAVEVRTTGGFGACRAVNADSVRLAVGASVGRVFTWGAGFLAGVGGRSDATTSLSSLKSVAQTGVSAEAVLTGGLAFAAGRTTTRLSGVGAGAGRAATFGFGGAGRAFTVASAWASSNSSNSSSLSSSSSSSNSEVFATTGAFLAANVFVMAGALAGLTDWRPDGVASGDSVDTPSASAIIF